VGLSKRAWILLTLTALLTPLGMLASGEAWGEWSISDWNVPRWWRDNAEKIASLWRAPLPDYNIPGWDAGLMPYVGYIISALVGIALIYLITKVLSKGLAGR
jgi:hypothetical protein